LDEFWMGGPGMICLPWHMKGLFLLSCVQQPFDTTFNSSFLSQLLLKSTKL